MNGGRSSLLEQAASALAATRFDPQHAGDIFLRADAEVSLREVLTGASVWSAGRDDARLPTARFMGATYRPDLLVAVGDAQVAIGITLLRNDPGPLTTAIVRAVLLARHLPVAMVILDRRIRRGEASGDGVRPSDQAVMDDLAARHQLRFVVHRQAPFSFG